MTTVLVYPNQAHLEELPRYSSVFYRPFPIISLGIPYLLAHVEATYKDNNLDKLSDHALAEWCLAQKPNIVGFGGTLSEWPQAAAVARLLKGKVTTIYGGPNATANPEKHVKYFDFVLRGYAEETFPRFLNGERDIPGLCWQGHIVEPCLTGDFLGWPSRRRLLEYNRTDVPVCPSPVDVVMSSRGCPFACRFCAASMIWGRCYQARAVEDVIEETRYMQRTFGTQTIHFREDNFTIDRNRLERMCLALETTGLKWTCQSRVKALDAETIRLMQRCGCVLVCCGFESANDETLEYIHKGHTFADIQHAIENLETAGLHYSGGFMVGLPNEGATEIQATLNYANWLSEQPHSFVPRGAARFVGIPVSPLYHEIIQEGLVAFNWQDGELLVPRTRKLTARQVEECMEVK